MNLEPTPAQTVGPFFGYALPYADGERLAAPHRPDALRVHGRVLDGHGQPVPDALLEIWQADPNGQPVQLPGSLRRDGHTFTGWGRGATDNTGGYFFDTLVPGRTDPGQAPFIAVTIFARGLMNRLFTRIYLPDRAELLTDTFLLGLAPDRRDTLIASTDPDGSLRHDLHLQGERETVFLNFGSR